MGERPDWTGTLLRERLLRPTVAGHGVPADSRRGNTLLPHPRSDALEARDRGLGSVEGLLGSRPPGTEAKGRGQEASDPTMASKSWKMRYQTAFAAYSAELLRQGWEDYTGSYYPWNVAARPEGWSEDDFNAELLRHGCEIPPDASDLAKILLNGLLYHRALFGRHKFFGQHKLFLESGWREEDHPLDENWRHMKKVRAMFRAKKAQKARDVQEARDKMKKERVDGRWRHSDLHLDREVAPCLLERAYAQAAARRPHRSH